MLNIQRYGNTTAATIPLCLWEWKHELNKGDLLYWLLLVVDLPGVLRW